MYNYVESTTDLPPDEVGEFANNTPGDSCDSQVKDCCANSIAWALSMLCFKYIFLCDPLCITALANEIYTSQLPEGGGRIHGSQWNRCWEGRLPAVPGEQY
jgi:hypothetical protein